MATTTIASAPLSTTSGQEPQIPPIADRQQKISEAAYFLAEQRQFESGYEFDDWLAAERLIEAQEQDLAKDS